MYFGRGGVIRTHDPLRPRQVRYQAALRPDICYSFDSKLTFEVAGVNCAAPSAKLYQNCIKTTLQPILLRHRQQNAWWHTLNEDRKYGIPARRRVACLAVLNVF